jgi:hypothetical protein
MSDSDDTDALVANIRGDGAVAAAPPHEYPSDMLSSSEEEEAPNLPVKKRKTTGRLTARRKKTTRRVSGASEEAPSPNTANNLLEGRVNDLEEETVELQRQLTVSEDNRKAGSATIVLLNKQAKLLKDQLKLTSGEDAAQEVVRLKGEVVVLSDASAKATRLRDELAVAKATVKELRMQVSKGTTGYSKLLGKYQRLKKDAKKEETSFKKEISTLKAEANAKAKKLKQDETAIAAEASSRATHAFKLQLKLQGDDYKAEKKKKDAKAKEQKRKACLGIANSVSSKGGGAFSIPRNEEERAAIFHPNGVAHPQQQYYHLQPAQQYLQPYAPLHGYGHLMPMQQYQPPMQYQPTMQYQPFPMQQYQPGMQQQAPYQPGVSQIYPPPPTMARASSASSVTPTPQEQGATYTMEEMEQVIGSNSLEIPDEDTQEEEAGDAVVGESQNSDLTVENPYA